MVEFIEVVCSVVCCLRLVMRLMKVECCDDSYIMRGTTSRLSFTCKITTRCVSSRVFSNTCTNNDDGAKRQGMDGQPGHNTSWKTPWIAYATAVSVFCTSLAVYSQTLFPGQLSHPLNRFGNLLNHLSPPSYPSLLQALRVAIVANWSRSFPFLFFRFVFFFFPSPLPQTHTPHPFPGS